MKSIRARRASCKFYLFTAPKDAPPEKLSIAFATADVTLTGWRLNRITEHLRDGNLLAVRSLPSRYSNLDPTALFVSEIRVEPIKKE